ncbi:hypothetical protein SLUN_00575 [Streptomyces lunaelactis]|uniref:Uncharacterized protein n=1 Tax=Streptomyces lunaelactis TaxID=1535768 RepID=A0A2R4SVT1_9ACTN|nr:hypothetical protein [Streptomyces lunaelactis]AVZ70980.1 hypothetical protein SLUN_00575 [Streptomyces lunaelactis]NUK24715.1 hypothetical protein [Streptomyces lunaelactis]NUK85969.1 hypothetical protein [Streptomyces lunaelactis]
MHAPDNPAGASPEPTPADRGGPQEASYEGALETVGRVLAWYNEQILKERRAPVPDEDRLERLQAERQACAADKRALEDAGPEEVSRIAADYDARFRELTGQ